jgi:cytochrome d ubiquinol oxidase subunit I
LLANSTGWIFTEVGRQPWTVFGVLTTADSVSPGVSAGDVALSLGLFTALYGILAVIELLLVLRYARGGAPDEVETAAQDDADRPLSFAY